MACSGTECRIKLTNIVTNPIQPDIVAVPANPAPPMNAWAHKKDMDAATTALLAAINAWARSTSTACQQPPTTAPGPGGAPVAVPFIPCHCRQVENADWTKAA